MKSRPWLERIVNSEKFSMTFPKRLLNGQPNRGRPHALPEGWLLDQGRVEPHLISMHGWFTGEIDTENAKYLLPFLLFAFFKSFSLSYYQFTS